MAAIAERSLSSRASYCRDNRRKSPSSSSEASERSDERVSWSLSLEAARDSWSAVPRTAAALLSSFACSSLSFSLSFSRSSSSCSSLRRRTSSRATLSLSTAAFFPLSVSLMSRSCSNRGLSAVLTLSSSASVAVDPLQRSASNCCTPVATWRKPTRSLCRDSSHCICCCVWPAACWPRAAAPVCSSCCMRARYGRSSCSTPAACRSCWRCVSSSCRRGARRGRRPGTWGRRRSS
mmetsp:Transcript_14192/g.55853  ORF Transcript_14192/g.55853 Transcript_14192/m.55853 type:complete len:235 (-) Transcript_14192:1238-1942(-)